MLAQDKEQEQEQPQPQPQVMQVIQAVQAHHRLGTRNHEINQQRLASATQPTSTVGIGHDGSEPVQAEQEPEQADRVKPD
jgi:hypothetical protein